MISNEEKINEIQNRIVLLSLHRTALENDILSNPQGDHPDKRPRQQVLDDILSTINALDLEKEALTNQG